MTEEKQDPVLDPTPMTEQEKQDILSMDEVMTYFLIDECGAFLFRITHAMGKGDIPEEDQPAIMADVVNIRQVQKFAVENLGRFGVDPETVKDRENGDYWKWLRFWNDWKNNLPDETWEKVSVGEYKDHLPTNSWKDE